MGEVSTSIFDQVLETRDLSHLQKAVGALSRNGLEITLIRHEVFCKHPEYLIKLAAARLFNVEASQRLFDAKSKKFYTNTPLNVACRYLSNMDVIRALVLCGATVTKEVEATAKLSSSYSEVQRCLLLRAGSSSRTAIELLQIAKSTDSSP